MGNGKWGTLTSENGNPQRSFLRHTHILSKQVRGTRTHENLRKNESLHVPRTRVSKRNSNFRAGKVWEFRYKTNIHSR